MDALWSLEDKLKISTPRATALLVSSLVLVIGVCAAIFRVIRKGRNRVVAEVSNKDDDVEDKDGEDEDDCSSCCDRKLLVKDLLSESVRWSKARRWEEMNRGFVERWRSRLWRSGRWRREGGIRRPVWQRRILMGEKCELPRFSGLILYDENGRPLSLEC